jgi:hypothetical protein
MTAQDSGVGDKTLGMRVLCAGLFVLGDVRDSLLIWQAKVSSFDASCSIDVQFLAGSGVEVTKAHLAGLHQPTAVSPST